MIQPVAGNSLGGMREGERSTTVTSRIRKLLAAILLGMNGACAKRTPWKITEIPVSDGKGKATHPDTDASTTGVAMVAYQVEHHITGDRNIMVWCYDTGRKKPLGSPILGNTQTQGHQEHPAVIFLPSGDFWLLFQGNQTGVSQIYERFFSGYCTPRGPEQPLNPMESDQHRPRGAVSHKGDRMAVWKTPSGIAGALTPYGELTRSLSLLSQPDIGVDDTDYVAYHDPALIYNSVQTWQPYFHLVFAHNKTGSFAAENRLFSERGNPMREPWQENTWGKRHTTAVTFLLNGQPFYAYGREPAADTLSDGNVLVLFEQFWEQPGLTQIWLRQETPLYPEDPMLSTPFDNDSESRMEILVLPANASDQNSYFSPSLTAIQNGAFAVAQMHFAENGSSAIRAALILPATAASFSPATAIVCGIAEIMILIYGIHILQRSRKKHG